MRTLLLDLDETLIHCKDSLEQPYDLQLNIELEEGNVQQLCINIRPFAKEFLREMSQIYEVVVFTASHPLYADKILDHLDPTGLLISHRLYRQHCTVVEGQIYMKDLRMLANRKLSDLLLVDNSAYSFGLQMENGVPILPYYNDPRDQELKDLMVFLRNISLYHYKTKDTRSILRETFKWYDIIQENHLQAVYQHFLIRQP